MTEESGNGIVASILLSLGVAKVRESELKNVASAVAQMQRLMDEGAEHKLVTALGQVHKGMIHGDQHAEAARESIRSMIELTTSARGVEQAQPLVAATGALREAIEAEAAQNRTLTEALERAKEREQAIADGLNRLTAWRIALLGFAGTVIAAALAATLTVMLS